MTTKLVCDRCTGEIEKLPNKMVANDREFDLCNKCWSEFLIFMGRPFYKVDNLPDRTKT